MRTRNELEDAAYSVAYNTIPSHAENCGPYRECRCHVVENAKKVIERVWRKNGLWED